MGRRAAAAVAATAVRMACVFALMLRPPCPPFKTPLPHPQTTGSCNYGYIRKDEPLGWDVAAVPDFMDGYEMVRDGMGCEWAHSLSCGLPCPTRRHAPPSSRLLLQPTQTQHIHTHTQHTPLPPPSRRAAAPASRSRATRPGSRTTTARSSTARGRATTSRSRSCCA